MQSNAAGRSRAANKSTSTAYQKEYPTNALEQADQYCVTYAQDNKKGHQVANRQPSAAGRSKAATTKKSTTHMKELTATAPEQEAQCSEAAPHNSTQSRQTSSEQPVAGRTRAATACNGELNSKRVTAPAGDQAGAVAEGHAQDNRRRQGGLQQQKPNAAQIRTASSVASTALRSKRKQAAEIALDVEDVRPVAKRMRGARTWQQSVVHDTDMPDAAAV